MTAAILQRHAGLSATTRLRKLANDAVSPTRRDWAILASFGALAALSSTFVELGIQRVPGQAILRVVFPFALGLALVPRHGAGCAMGCCAAITASLLQHWGIRGEGLGLGGFTSLIATGPCSTGYCIAPKGVGNSSSRSVWRGLRAICSRSACAGSPRRMAGKLPAVGRSGVAATGPRNLHALRHSRRPRQRADPVLVLQGARIAAAGTAGMMYVGIDDTDILGARGTSAAQPARTSSRAVRQERRGWKIRSTQAGVTTSAFSIADFGWRLM